MTRSESAVEPEAGEGDGTLRPDSPLLYDEGYYRSYEGGTYDRGGHWTRFFGYISDEVVARWNPKRTLDAGCALGVFVEELRSRGVEAWGTDISQFAIDSMPDELRQYCRQGSLAEELHPDLPGRYDLITCIEVLEHMERGEGDKAIGVLCSLTDRILFSSTPDGYAEPTHFTCRAPEEWSAVFARHGFYREYDADAAFVSPWAVVYARRDLTPYQLTLEYERTYAKMREENRQLRAAVIDLDKKVAAAGAEALQEEIARLRTELMAARDQMVGAQAEGSSAKAVARDGVRQVEERARTRTVDEVEDRMKQTTTWKVGSAILRPLDIARRSARRLRSDHRDD